MPSLLPGADKDLVKVFQKSIEPKFEKILLKTKVAKLEDTGKKIKVKLEGKNLEKDTLEFDKADWKKIDQVKLNKLTELVKSKKLPKAL